MNQARIDDLDVIRAVAVFGLLPMNILVFANPLAAYFNPGVMFSDQLSTYLSHFITFVFFDQKMMGLFSLLFGSSMMLLISKHRSQGVSTAKKHYKRYLWLLGFGLLHLFFLWQGDILHLYAVCAVVIYPLLRLSPKGLFIVSGFLWTVVLYAYARLHGSLIEIDFSLVANEAASYNPSYHDLAVEISAYQRGYWAVLSHVFSEENIYQSEADKLILNTFYLTSFLRALAMMLLGAGLYQMNFWTQPPAESFKAWAYRLVFVGILLASAGFFYSYSQHWQTSTMAVGVFLNQLATPLLVLGYVLWIRFLMASAWRPKLMWFAPVGRMAFTLYITQSILMTGLFYGWGFGLYGTLSRPELWLVIFATWLTLFVLAHLWLKRFSQGPLEALWRRLSR